LSAFNSVAETIAHRHVALSIKGDLYYAVQKNLMLAIKDVLGEEFTPEH